MTENVVKAPLRFFEAIDNPGLRSQYDCIFLSPHLDDVVLSCGGTVSRRIQEGATALIVTVAAGNPPHAPLSDLARKAHEFWALDSNAMAARRHEDAEACDRLGAHYLHLSLPDCIYRWNTSGSCHYYKTQEDIFSKPNPREASLVAHIAQLIRKIPIGNQVFAPLGVGGHVDHVITRSAAEAVFANSLFYYEDYPYCTDLFALERAIQIGTTLTAWVKPLPQKCLQTKISSVRAYRSQLVPVFCTPDAVERRLEEHALTTGGERFWSVADEENHE